MDVKEYFGWKLQQNHCCFSELMRLAKEKLATVTTVQGNRGETLYVFNSIDSERSSEGFEADDNPAPGFSS